MTDTSWREDDRVALMLITLSGAYLLTGWPGPLIVAVLMFIGHIVLAFIQDRPL